MKKFKEQQKLSENINPSRSRVSKIKATDTDGEIDLSIESLLSLGATREDIATAISGNQ